MLFKHAGSFEPHVDKGFQLKKSQPCLAVKKEIMKNLVLVLFILGLVACDDKTGVEPKETFLVEANGSRWTGTTVIQTDASSDSLTILGIMPRPEGVIWMRIKFQGPGQYSLKNNCGYYSTVGRDVRTSEYRLGPGETANFTITQYDETEKSIEGTFEMTFEKIYSNPDTAVEILNFTNGSLKGEMPPL